MDQIKGAIKFAAKMYEGELCRICGTPIESTDLQELIFAGYSKCRKSRCAHGVCWKHKPEKEYWAFPDDDNSSP